MPYARAIFASDWHVGHHDRPLLKAFRSFCRDRRLTKNDQIILGGDVGDFASVSSHGDVNPPRLIDEAAELNDFLDEIQDVAGRAKVVYLFGNHEARVDRFIGQQAPTLQGITSVSELLHLDDRGIEYHPYGHVHFVGKLGHTHGAFAGDNHAIQHYRRFGCNLVYGHTHRPQSYIASIREGHVRGAFGQGCMAPKTAPYIKGRPTAWMQSFHIAHVDLRTGHFFPNTLLCDDGAFMYDGKVYRGNR